MNVVLCLFEVGKTLSLYTSITIKITQMDLICLYKANDYYLQKRLLQKCNKARYFGGIHIVYSFVWQLFGHVNAFILIVKKQYTSIPYIKKQLFTNIIHFSYFYLVLICVQTRVNFFCANHIRGSE